jgi:hypothetical protein
VSEEIKSLLDRMLDRENELNPVGATFKGIHTYDEDWDDPGLEGLEAYEDYVREFTHTIDKEHATAAGEDVVDLTLAKSYLANSRIYIEQIRQMYLNPMNVPGNVINAIFIMVVRDYAPFEERMDYILARLGKVPAYCRDAMHVFTKPVDRYVAMAEELVTFGGPFLAQLVPALAEKGSQKHAPYIRDAGMKAAAALEAFIEHIKGLPTTPDFATGTDAFNAMLHEYHLLDYDCDSMLTFGMEQFDQTQKELVELAHKIKPGTTPAQLIAGAKKDHPLPGELLDFYRSWMAKSRQFVLDKNLCGMPSGEELEIIPTPEYERPTIPYAAYMPPALYEPRQKGFFYVTPVEPSMPPEEQQQRLEGHNNIKVPITALHEGYPGHHLQLCRANKIPNRIRREMGHNTLIEGWALYCEEMMREQGFYSDDLMVLGQKNDTLWRAARVIIDVSLHTGKMSFDQAVEFLKQKVGLEQVNAESEVKRYIYTPTQPMSYLVGKASIMKLREDYRAKYPSASLREFHDKVLSVGSLPLSIVRQEVLG